MKELFAAAARSEVAEIEKLLQNQVLKSSININFQNEQGDTLLHVAAANGSLEIIKILLQLGADTTIKNHQGQIPAELAQSRRHENISNYLNKNVTGKREYQASQELIDVIHQTQLSIQEEPSHHVAELSPLLSGNLSPQIVKLLRQAGLDEEDLAQASIQLSELKRLLSRSLYGHFLYWLSLNQIVEKLFLWPFLRQQAVTDKDVSVVQSNDYDETSEEVNFITFKSSANSHLWPTSRSLLIANESILRKVYAITGFFEGAGFLADRGWTALLAILLSLDIYNYYYFPRYGNTLGMIFSGRSTNSKSLSVLLMDPKVWPEVLGIPLLWGVGKAISRVWQMQRWNVAQSEMLSQQLISYQPSIVKDLFYWMPSLISLQLIPEPTIKRSLEKIEQALLWNGRLTAEQRLQLFKAVRQLTIKATKLTKIHALGTLAVLADGISEKDYPALARAGIRKDMLRTLLFIKTEAFALLRHVARQEMDYETQTPMTISKLHTIYAHYQLWRLGQPETYLLQPLFWSYQLINYYLRAYFLWRVGYSIYTLINTYLEKQKCLNEGKLWLYMGQTAKYECTVCGDWPVFYKNAFQDDTCWYDYIQTPHNAEEMAEAIRKINFQNITNIDFSSQPVTDEWLPLVLNALQPKILRIDNFFLVNEFDIIYGVTDCKANFSLPGFQAFKDFVQNKSIENLWFCNYRKVSNESALVFSETLIQSQIKYLTYENYASNASMDNVWVVLAQRLPETSLQQLWLMGNVGDASVNAIATYLPQSSVQNLFLVGNFGDVSVSKLFGQLPHAISQLRLWGDFGDPSIMTLASNFSSNLTLLTLNGDFTDSSVPMLAAQLPYANL